MGAAGVALVALIAAILLGPDQQSIKKRFEYYGAPGEMQIMPEVSIDRGRDQVHQLPKSLQEPPPPANLEIEREDLDPDATEKVMVNELQQEVDTDRLAELPDPDAQDDSDDQVELSLPLQSNPDWFVLHEVRPAYPLKISAKERRTPVIFVRVAIFVGPNGDVLEAMITGTDGSRPFTDEVLEKVRQWKFGWRVAPGAGRWIEMTWNFKSPFFREKPPAGQFLR